MLYHWRFRALAATSLGGYELLCLCSLADLNIGVYEPWRLAGRRFGVHDIYLVFATNRTFAFG